MDKKMWYIYPVEYYTAEKNNILNFAGKWMEPENIILGETQKDNYHMYSLISGL